MDNPVVIFKYDKATQETYFLSQLATIYAADECYVDYEVLVDDKNYIIVEHKRATPKCTCGGTGATKNA